MSSYRRFDGQGFAIDSVSTTSHTRRATYLRARSTKQKGKTTKFNRISKKPGSRSTLVRRNGSPEIRPFHSHRFIIYEATSVRQQTKVPPQLSLCSRASAKALKKVRKSARRHSSYAHKPSSTSAHHGFDPIQHVLINCRSVIAEQSTIDDP